MHQYISQTSISSLFAAINLPANGMTFTDDSGQNVFSAVPHKFCACLMFEYSDMMGVLFPCFLSTQEENCKNKQLLW